MKKTSTFAIASVFFLSIGLQACDAQESAQQTPSLQSRQQALTHRQTPSASKKKAAAGATSYLFAMETLRRAQAREKKQRKQRMARFTRKLKGHTKERHKRAYRRLQQQRGLFKKAWQAHKSRLRTDQRRAQR